MRIQTAPHFSITRNYTQVKLLRAQALRSSMTSAERRLWHALKSNQFHNLHFRRQQVVAGFIADFYCDAARLIIELDGAVHDQTGEYDAERDQVLTDLGLTVLRLQNNQIFQTLEAVLTQITTTTQTNIKENNRP